MIWKMLCLRILLSYGCLHFVSASKYSIHNSADKPTYSHAEKMFATDRGPIFARKGNSSVHLQIDAINVSKIMNGWDIVGIIYHAKSYREYAQLESVMEEVACSVDTGNSTIYGASDVEVNRFPIKNEKAVGTATYLVRSSGWIATQIFFCPSVKTKNDSVNGRDGAREDDFISVTPLITYTGMLIIRSPSGLLPAAFYGMLPFSGFLAIGHLFLYIFFAVLLVLHRSQIIGLHYGIFAILFLGTLSSTIWFAALYIMNQSGEPICCPYPAKLIIAVISSTLMRTLARAILIVVCLGYGIVRNCLSKWETGLAVLLSVTYFTSGVGDEISRGTSSGIEFRQAPTAWSFVQLFSDLIFIIWIHISMERILHKLNAEKQYAKLRMYQLLAWSLATFIVTFSILTMIAISSHVGVFEWSVEWEWTQLVAWPVLNFVVTAAMSIIWRPTRTSSNLAYSMQLPFSDDAEMEAQPSLTSTKTGSIQQEVGKGTDIQDSRSQSATFIADCGDSDDETSRDNEGRVDALQS